METTLLSLTPQQMWLSSELSLATLSGPMNIIFASINSRAEKKKKHATSKQILRNFSGISQVWVLQTWIYFVIQHRDTSIGRRFWHISLLPRMKFNEMYFCDFWNVFCMNKTSFIWCSSGKFSKNKWIFWHKFHSVLIHCITFSSCWCDVCATV